MIGRLPGERSCLSLVWAVLDRASRGWRGIEQSLGSIRLLADLRRQLCGQIVLEGVMPDDEVAAEIVTAAA